ncbi:MAG: ribosome-associated protein [Thermosediminibacterales bacterium]|nr:ribosome-associated protein [Thermosediminibacterales bacterium]MDK2835494.1 ribosome-associated protein [Thermosediminibacterales bacterium]
MIENSRRVAEIAAKALDDKKAKDIVVLGIYNVSLIADYFVIASGTSTVQVKALADEVEERLQENGVDILHKEGYNDARWILLDYGDVVVHIFHEKERSFYDLERVWADAETIELDI